jgi:hypothetical protein
LIATTLPELKGSLIVYWKVEDSGKGPIKKDYVVIPSPLADDKEALAPWVRESMRFVQTSSGEPTHGDEVRALQANGWKGDSRFAAKKSRMRSTTKRSAAKSI